MPRRIIFGAMALLTVFLLVWGDALISDANVARPGRISPLLARGSLIPLLALAMCLAGVAEFTRLLRTRGVTPCVRSTYLWVGLILLAPWLGAGLSWNASPALGATFASMVSMTIAVVWIGASLVFRNQTDGALRDFGGTLLMLVYVGLLPSFLLHIRSGVSEPGAFGAWLALSLILVTKASDIGAYFVGTYLGRHKLVPRISPGKSVEGAVGGLIFSGIVAAIILPKIAGAAPPTFDSSDAVVNLVEIKSTFGILESFIIGLILSLMGQLGDLLESCFKRDAGTKDSGHLLPRYGGVLDLIDSPVLALPVAWLILTFTR